MGVRIVLVLGLKQQIDALIHRAGGQPQYAGGYRITDRTALTAAAEAIGAARAEVEARLSKVRLIHSANWRHILSLFLSNPGQTMLRYLNILTC